VLRAFVIASVALVAAAAPAAAAPNARGAGADPRGNNGTVKIDGIDFDDHPDNEPHVGCEFQVDFYGFDHGDYRAAVSFAAHAPTPGTLTIVQGSDSVFIGGDPASGGTDLDGSDTYRLGFDGTPHDQQGIHVKLTVHAPFSQGADVKHKVFWVQPCGQPLSPVAQTPESPSKPEPEGNPAAPNGGPAHRATAGTRPEPPVVPAPVVDAMSAAVPTAAPAAPAASAAPATATAIAAERPAQVLGVSYERAAVASPTLARTGGATSIPLLHTGSILVALGAALRVLSRRNRAVA
jgi:hypothetical protein